jgi:hypothetical protein
MLESIEPRKEDRQTQTEKYYKRGEKPQYVADGS